MTAAERALELLAETAALPGVPIVRDGVPVPVAEVQIFAEFLEVLTRYRAALQDLVVETAGLQRAAARDVTPEQEYNHERAADAIAALDHLYNAWRGRLSTRELSEIFGVTAALQRAAAEDRA